MLEQLHIGRTTYQKAELVLLSTCGVAARMVPSTEEMLIKSH